MRSDGCCPGVRITRTVVSAPSPLTPNDVLHRFSPNNRELTAYKAAALVVGYSRKARMSSIGGENPFEYKGIGHTALSLAIPGDSDRFRSPIRSAFYRAVTPGVGGRRGGSRPGENRGYRCPEGYEHGGRFTDSRFSTCGAKLFDIPGILGVAIGAIENSRFRGPAGASGETITGGPYPQSTGISRRPDILIPKVQKSNRSALDANVDELVRQLGSTSGRNARLVRRDGFVLEPVVPASVLRVIPDNRNMEGATYVSSVLTRSDFGGDELGMLSNTGISSLVYVMPGGSTVSVSKSRQLSVGERRKLGRTVNAARAMRGKGDPLAALRYVANESGDAISYRENFVGIRNPHQMVGDGRSQRERWVDEVFGRIAGRLKERSTAEDTRRRTDTFGEVSSPITNVEEAMAHVRNGGSLGDIAPATLAELLSTEGFARLERVGENASRARIGSYGYAYTRRGRRNEAIGERLAEDFQQFLGMESPDVYLVGRGERRGYLREDAATAVVGSTPSRSADWREFDPADVARLMVADLVSGVTRRDAESVVNAPRGDGATMLAVSNPGAGLMDLSKIEIARRAKEGIDDMLNSQLMSRYSQYYASLRAQQQRIMRQNIAAMLRRARRFNFAQWRTRLSEVGGLSEGEKIHIRVVEKIMNQRIDSLMSAGNAIRKALES